MRDAVLALLRGIDPLYRGNSVSAPGTNYFIPITILRQHGTSPPSRSTLFNQYQLGKIYNPLLILASTCYAFVFFGRFGMRGSYRWLLTLIVLLSPVPLSQWTTYYV
jgi:hypothetical protein